MATFNFQKQPMAANESRLSSEVVVPSGLTEIKAELSMNAAEMKDPATDVVAHLEFFDAIELNDWRLIASIQLTGSPLNTRAGTPHVRIDGDTLVVLVGKRVRCRIEAKSAGSYGAVLSWT